MTKDEVTHVILSSFSAAGFAACYLSAKNEIPAVLGGPSAAEGVFMALLTIKHIVEVTPRRGAGEGNRESGRDVKTPHP